MRKLSTLLASAAFAAGLAISLDTLALPYPQPGQEMVVTYYGSAAKTTVVGVRSYHSGCDVHHISWGSTSAYSTISYYGCVDPEY